MRTRDGLGAHEMKIGFGGCVADMGCCALCAMWLEHSKFQILTPFTERGLLVVVRFDMGALTARSAR
jgi:hypothetical protein